MTIIDLTDRELYGITYQAGRDAAPNMDPVDWFTGRAAYDAEVMARNADADAPRRLAEDIAALPAEKQEEIREAIIAARPPRGEGGVRPGAPIPPEPGPPQITHPIVLPPEINPLKPNPPLP